MLIWCITLFGLGVVAFLDTFFNYGEIFRRVNSILFMLLSLGLLVRTNMQVKLGKIETMLKQNNGPEGRLAQSDQSPAQQKQETKTEKVY